MKTRQELIRELVDVQNELEAYAPVDIMTITGFMQTNEEIEKHIERNKQLVEKYKKSAL